MHACRHASTPLVHDHRCTEVEVSFPSLSGRFLSQVHQRERAIIEALQPYHGLDWPQRDGTLVYRHPLAVLNRLSNQDKHRLPALALFRPRRIRLENIEAQDARYAGLSYRQAPYSVGEVAFTVNYVSTGPNPRLDFALVADPIVAFDDGLPVLDTLECAAHFVAGVLREFDT